MGAGMQGGFVKTAIIICARWQSERLPGKMLMDIEGKPMLMRIVERCRQSKLADDVIVATTPSSTPIVDYCIKTGIPCFIGSENDILSRLYETAVEHKLDVVVRVWGDCPLIDPEIIDRVIQFREDGQYDYAYNIGWPVGQTVAVLPFSTLFRVNKDLKSSKDREWLHVYFTNCDYNIGVLKNETDQSHKRMVVDNLNDLEKVRKIYASKRDN